MIADTSDTVPDECVERGVRVSGSVDASECVEQRDCVHADLSRKPAAARVFETARDLFYRRGIRAVGVDEIVCGAGVTKPTLYRAFGSKDELVAACLTDAATQARAGVEAVIAAAGSDPRERLSAVVAHFAEKTARPDFRGCLMSNVAIELTEPEHPGRLVVEQCKAGLRGVLGGLTRELGVAAPETLADGLLLIIEGGIASHHVFGSQGPARSLLTTCETLIEAHVAAGAPPSTQNTQTIAGARAR